MNDTDNKTDNVHDGIPVSCGKDNDMLKERIKLMSDTCSDIPKSLADELGIRMLCFPVMVDGESYREVQDFTKEEFYEKIASAKEYPTTAQLTPFEIREAFEALYQEGYTDVIYVTIGSGGSATHGNAIVAREQFYQEAMQQDRPMRIHLVDGRNYTATYGYAVVEAGKMLRRGASVQEMLDYLEDWTASASVYFVPLTLKYAKRSGRISATAAFAGELLGLRPVCEITDCNNTILHKVRGEQHIIPKLVEIARERMIPHTPYLILAGKDNTLAKELAAVLTKQLGYPPAIEWKIGATVTCNAGPEVVGLVIRQMRRGTMPE